MEARLIRWLRSLFQGKEKVRPETEGHAFVVNDIEAWTVGNDLSSSSQTDETDNDCQKAKRLEDLTAGETWPTPFP